MKPHKLSPRKLYSLLVGIGIFILTLIFLLNDQEHKLVHFIGGMIGIIICVIVYFTDAKE